MLMNIIYFLIVIGILVTIHEGGHYFAARLCKVKVLRFSIGFGKVLYSYTSKKTQTQYSISAIPLGGYVSLLGQGENKDNNDQFYDSEFSYANKSKLQRAFIIIAGPLANIILAFIIFVFLGLGGVYTLKPNIAAVFENSIAYESGLRDGDRIVAINDEPTNDASYILNTILVNINHKDVKLSVVDKSGMSKDVMLRLSNVNPGRLDNIEKTLGFIFKRFDLDGTLAFVVPNSSAYEAGLKEGDKIIQINNQIMANWYHVQNFLENLKSDKIQLLVQRGDKIYKADATLHPFSYEGKEFKKGLGVSPKVISNQDLYIINKLDFFASIRYAFEQTYEVSTLIIKSLRQFIIGAISIENLSGPISIAQGATQTAELGVKSFLGFLALVSVNLGILNLLPIPILDGGHLMGIIYEGVTGKKANAKVSNVLSLLGFAILISLTVLALFNDIINLL